MDTVNIQVTHPGQPGGGSNLEKTKEWQMELLMEKLRSKTSSFKSFIDIAKNMRMTMLDKRFSLDSVEKSQLQKCLDTLQHSIKVISLQSMMERLECLTRQLGLKFTPSLNGTEVFISSDMFFLEVLLEPTGAVKDVKIHHEGKNDAQSCEELVTCLSRGDFVDFTAQLEGLVAIYQINADKKIKCRAFSALQSLETDLGIQAQLQTFMKEPFNLVHKGPVGILERRKGGHPMKLTYFVSPYDLIDRESHSCDTLSLEAVVSKKLGHSVTVCMEGSTMHKLPTSSIITINRSPAGKSTPSYAPLTGTNSSMLPACFILKLANKIPMCLELVRKIQKVTELECIDISVPRPLLRMIVQHASNGQVECRNNKGVYVTLPDQQHCYWMTENKTMEGVLIGSIPFTHPAHVGQILMYLRQQALFNTLVSSCVRTMACSDLEASIMFEISALSWQCILVSLQHPVEQTMATVEFDLTDISALKCHLHGLNSYSDQSSELASKVLQRSLSVPLTMRTLIKAWESRTSTTGSVNGLSGNSGNGSFNVNLGPGRDENNGPNGHSGVPDFGNGDVKIQSEPGNTMNGAGTTAGSRQQLNQQQQQSFLDAGAESSIGFPSFSGQSDTPVGMLNPLQLGVLLGQAKIAAGVTLTPTEKSKKTRKRKSGESGFLRGPKVKSEMDSGEIILESSSSDSTPLGTPTSGRDAQNDTRTPTPTSAASGLDLSNLDTSDIMGTDKSSDYDVENETEIMEVTHHESEDSKRERKMKRREEKKSPTTIFEESKSLVPPSLSITPISSSGIGPNSVNYNSVLSELGLDRRAGIEIFPITSSSITITAISGPKDDERKERKKNRSSEDSKNKVEKKRKRKKEESPMGPPEKLPLKSDPLSKPVSVSIKPTESPPGSLGSSRPTSPATSLSRKFSPSPTHIATYVGKSSPTALKQQSGGVKPMLSPKHIPMMPASVSPKHGSTSSPKHGGSGSSGKPSMSALKSAASSPSNKSDISKSGKSSSSYTSSGVSSSSSSKETGRDKEKKTSLNLSGSSGRQSPKSKSSCAKPKQFEAMGINDSGQQSSGNTSAGNTTPPSEMGKSGTSQQQARNRKSSLSAVIDKLKNAQNCSDEGANGKLASGSAMTPGTTGSSSTSTTASSPSSQKVSSSNKLSAEGKGTTKNPAEYMVKPGSEGIKLTINKKGSMKDAKSNLKLSGVSSNSTGSNSPKTHTGLKPGVNSGPASKKTPMSPKMTLPMIGGLGNKSLVSGGAKSGTCKNLVSGGSQQKGTKSSLNSGLPKTSSGATDLSRVRDKSRFVKSAGDKALFGSSKSGKPSPSSSLESDSERAFKLLAHASMTNMQGLPQLAVEGFMKQLDTKFQIPKLSARANADNPDKRSSGSNLEKQDMTLGKSEQVSRSSPMHGKSSNEHQGGISSQGEVDVPTNLSMQQDDAQAKYPDDDCKDMSLLMPKLQDNLGEGSDLKSLNLSTKLGEKEMFHQESSFKATSPHEAAEMLLDFSTPKDKKVGAPPLPPPPPPPPPLPSALASHTPSGAQGLGPVQAKVPGVGPSTSNFPLSPSVSVHIVKSPAPSPRVIPPSPHSASPCITDDELMDEALVGMGK